jgi:hypothetical protein
MERMGPKTVESSTVEQFQRLFLNWNWHSLMPLRAPLPTCIMWSVYNMHSFFCPEDSPLICFATKIMDSCKFDYT